MVNVTQQYWRSVTLYCRRSRELHFPLPPLPALHNTKIKFDAFKFKNLSDFLVAPPRLNGSLLSPSFSSLLLGPSDRKSSFANPF